MPKFYVRFSTKVMIASSGKKPYFDKMPIHRNYEEETRLVG
jgi:hypothetical protein